MKNHVEGIKLFIPILKRHLKSLTITHARSHCKQCEKNPSSGPEYWCYLAPKHASNAESYRHSKSVTRRTHKQRVQSIYKITRTRVTAIAVNMPTATRLCTKLIQMPRPSCLCGAFNTPSLLVYDGIVPYPDDEIAAFFSISTISSGCYVWSDQRVFGIDWVRENLPWYWRAQTSLW